MSGPLKLPPLSHTPPGTMTPRGRAILKTVARRVGVPGKILPSEQIQNECKDRGYRLKLHLHRGINSYVTLARVMQHKIRTDISLASIVQEADHDLCVVKVLEKNAPGYNAERMNKYALREMRAHSRLQGHPHVLRVYEFWCTEDYAYLVTEVCEHGDLANYETQWKSWTERGLPEPEARRIFRQLVSAVQYAHNTGFAHRDIKMENVLLDSKCNVRLADFGFALQLSSERPVSVCGSEDYMSPEVRFNSALCYDARMADVWSLGVLLHMVVVGHIPYDIDSMELQHDIEHDRLRFLDYGSDDYVSLVSEMLQHVAENRLTINEIAEHCWLTQGECRRMYLPSVVPHRSEVADRTRHVTRQLSHSARQTRPFIGQKSRSANRVSRCSCCSRDSQPSKPPTLKHKGRSEENTRLLPVKLWQTPMPDNSRYSDRCAPFTKKHLLSANKDKNTAARVTVLGNEKKYITEKNVHVTSMQRSGYLKGCQILSARRPACKDERQRKPRSTYSGKSRTNQDSDSRSYIASSFFKPRRNHDTFYEVRKPYLKLNISQCSLETRREGNSGELREEKRTSPEMVIPKRYSSIRKQTNVLGDINTRDVIKQCISQHWGASTVSKKRVPRFPTGIVAPPVFMRKLEADRVPHVKENMTRYKSILPPIVIPCPDDGCESTSPTKELTDFT